MATYLKAATASLPSEAQTISEAREAVFTAATESKQTLNTLLAQHAANDLAAKKDLNNNIKSISFNNSVAHTRLQFHLSSIDAKVEALQMQLDEANKPKWFLYAFTALNFLLHILNLYR